MGIRLFIIFIYPPDSQENVGGAVLGPNFKRLHRPAILYLYYSQFSLFAIYCCQVEISIYFCFLFRNDCKRKSMKIKKLTANYWFSLLFLSFLKVSFNLSRSDEYSNGLKALLIGSNKPALTM